MRDYVFRPEVVRVALVVGVVTSVLFYERVQLTTGGAIVPSYLALALPQPLFALTTVAAGYATYVVVHHGLARRVILYGRRKFEIEVLVGPEKPSRQRPPAPLGRQSSSPQQDAQPVVDDLGHDRQHLVHVAIGLRHAPHARFSSLVFVL